MLEIDKKLEAYKLVNSRLNSEVDEFYSIQQLFLAIQAIGVFGMLTVFYQFDEDWLMLVPLSVFFITAQSWKDINGKAETWRNYWVEAAKNLEKDEVLGKITLWRDTEKDSLRGVRGVWKAIAQLPDIFSLIWLLFFFYFFLNNY